MIFSMKVPIDCFNELLFYTEFKRVNGNTYLLILLNTWMTQQFNF